jgi:hypothetical protein
MIIVSKSYIKEALQRLGDQGHQNMDNFRRRAMTSTISDINEVSVIHSSPYEGYAVYLVRKLTPLSDPFIL